MLQLQNVSYYAPDGDEKEILKNISLEIKNKFTVITGPNGSGKSTLAKMIAGIIKPTSGRIILDGDDITDLNVTERANKGISFAFQQPVRFKGITVKDLITIAAGKKINTGDVCKYLSEVGLCARDYVDREVNASLSGGELKRIEIATLLARGTKLSVFDEPEAGIDLWSFNNLIEAFVKMRDRSGGNVIIISHQERILNIAGEIVLLQNGEIVKVGSKEEVMPLILDAGRTCSMLEKKSACFGNE